MYFNGIKVDFPFEPYGSQRAYMSQLIKALNKGENALLESPTGSGKTLALLCSSLAWQKHEKEKKNEIKIDNETITSFTSIRNKKNIKNIPKIIVSSRTHSQIKQIVKELKNTNYRPYMTVLASREHYCIHGTVISSKNKNEDCNTLMSKGTCKYGKQFVKLKHENILNPGGKYEVHDIEDLVKVGTNIDACPYFGSKHRSEICELILAPYNYLIDPMIRTAMQIELDNTIVIIDEAHNIEDVCREAASQTLDIASIEYTLKQLMKLISKKISTDIYTILGELCKNITEWYKHACSQSTLPRVFQKDELFNIISSWNINIYELKKLLNEAGQLKRQAAENNTPCLDSISLKTLESLITVLGMMIKDNWKYLNSYRLSLYYEEVRNKLSTNNFEQDNCISGNYISFWCLNPAVGFENFAEHTHSVILTSGTLSPLDSFSSELGSPFPHRLESGHIIGSHQLLVRTILKSPNGQLLNASYRNSSSTEYQDALGKTIIRCIKSVPSGVIIFFPSYSLMDRMIKRWKNTNIWKNMKKIKYLLCEPRSADKFESAMAKFSANVNKKSGAVFFAVCRGKLSEGIDFSNHLARAVLIVGIPYPNTQDPQIKLKREYNDEMYQTKSKHYLTGSKWYTLQAYRAVNQAMGRCIRHRNDYGSIILLDERFTRTDVRNSISRWIRNFMHEPLSIENCFKSIDDFFIGWKEKEAINKKIEKKKPSIIEEEKIEIYVEKKKSVHLKDGNIFCYFDPSTQSQSQQQQQQQQQQDDGDDTQIITPEPIRVHPILTKRNRDENLLLQNSNNNNDDENQFSENLPSNVNILCKHCHSKFFTIKATTLLCQIPECIKKVGIFNDNMEFSWCISSNNEYFQNLKVYQPPINEYLPSVPFKMCIKLDEFTYEIMLCNNCHKKVAIHIIDCNVDSLKINNIWFDLNTIVQSNDDQIIIQEQSKRKKKYRKKKKTTREKTNNFRQQIKKQMVNENVSNYDRSNFKLQQLDVQDTNSESSSDYDIVSDDDFE